MGAEWNESVDHDCGRDDDDRGCLENYTICLSWDYVLLGSELEEVRKGLEESREKEPDSVIATIVDTVDCNVLRLIAGYGVECLDNPANDGSDTEWQLIPPLSSCCVAFSNP